ncbi:hypothetical protein [Pseudooceanicola sp.]|uniref:hypothetical protein n=1 Tax=Pseudooceanicola sp. TaxID=1914328 RepID=UPI002634570E|nr:hypothetical protein [Pseudooceanicola sp.]MDF1856098.1 hypothetical protein [Pseudooceanicola sp.]
MLLRPAFALLLVALLTLTGQAAAIARGQPGAAGWAELCTGSGPVMVALDSAGQPIGPAHLCPDNAFLLLQAIAVQAPVIVPLDSQRRIFLALDIITAHTPAAEAPSARGPPVLS